MNFYKQISLTALILICSFGLYGQKHLAKAERQYELKAFDLAIENAKKAIEKDPQCVSCHRLVAESFRMMNNHVDAAIWYRKMERFGNLPSDYALNYGMLLKRMGQFQKAKRYFIEYKIVDQELGTHFAQSCDFAIAALSEERDFELNLFGTSSKQTDFGPAIYKDKIVFSSFRSDFKRNLSATATTSFDDHKCQFFISQNASKSSVDDMQYLLKDNEETYDMGPIHYASAAPICAVTRHNFKDGEKQIFSQDLELSLHLAEVELDGSFRNLVPFPYNEVGYATGFGTLNAKGNILYFSSNRPGGHGGFDIYVSYFKNGKWTQPANLGPQINTQGNEITPFFDGEKLFYSSDFTTGIGGFDVFTTSVVDGAWKTPLNMGNGVNSPEDDYYFVKHPQKESYYLTSNRLGGRGLHDIYLVHKIQKEEIHLEYTQNESIPRAINLESDLVAEKTQPTKRKVNLTEPVKSSTVKESKPVTDPTTTRSTSKDKATHEPRTKPTISTEEILPTESEASVIDFNELLPPKAMDLNLSNAKTVSLVGAKRIAYGEVITEGSNVYFIQLAALFRNEAKVGQFAPLSEYGSLYRVKQANATKIKLGYFHDEYQAKEVLRQVKARGHQDAFITYEALNPDRLQLVTVADEKNVGHDGHHYNANSQGETYKVRLASYEDPIWFDVNKVNDIGVIEQWSKGGWTIFVMSGYKSLEEAEMAKVAATERGFADAAVVVDRNGILEKLY